MVGDGPERPALMRLSSYLGVQDVITFLGYRRDIPTVAAATDIAVLSSDNEGTPVWLIEAAAAGVPAVATDVGGVLDVVPPGSGVVVPPRSAAAFASAIIQLARDSETRRAMGTYARRHVLSLFTADRLVEDMADLYRSLLASPTRNGARYPTKQVAQQK
jgi:glycosyltransferase involved in cell wall biosynthesis